MTTREVHETLQGTEWEAPFASVSAAVTRLKQSEVIEVAATRGETTNAYNSTERGETWMYHAVREYHDETGNYLLRVADRALGLQPFAGKPLEAK